MKNKYYKATIIFLLATRVWASVSEGSGRPEVIALAQIIREGPSEPRFDTENEDFVSAGGEEVLSSNGKRVLLGLGQEVAAVYNDFISTLQNFGHATLYSDRRESCIQSAYAFSLGLQNLSEARQIIKKPRLSYPPFKGFTYEFSNESPLPSNYTAFGIKTENELNRFFSRTGYFMEAQRRQCPLLFQEFDSHFHKIDSITEDTFSGLLEMLREIGAVPKFFKEEGWTYRNLRSLYKSSELRYSHERLYDEDIDLELFEMLSAWYAYSLHLQYFDQNSKKGAYLTNQILNSTIQNFKKLADEQSSDSSLPKYQAFFNDGTQVYLILKLLGLSPSKCLIEIAVEGYTNTTNCLLFPKFGSSITFELSRLDKQYYARILYNLRPIHLPCQSTDLNNGYCSLDTFLELAEESLLYKDFHQTECIPVSEKALQDPIEAIEHSSTKAEQYKILFYCIWGVTLLLFVGYLVALLRPRQVEIKNFEEKFSYKKQGLYSGLGMRSLSSMSELALRGNLAISPSAKNRRRPNLKIDLQQIKEEKQSAGKSLDGDKNENKDNRGGFNMKIKELSLEEDMDFGNSEIGENNDDYEMENIETLPSAHTESNPYDFSPDKLKKSDSVSSSEVMSPVNFRNRLNVFSDMRGSDISNGQQSGISQD